MPLLALLPPPRLPAYFVLIVPRLIATKQPTLATKQPTLARRVPRLPCLYLMEPVPFMSLICSLSLRAQQIAT